MQLKVEIANRILDIQAKADADKLKIQTTADAVIAELQKVLDQGGGWLLNDTDKFQSQVNRVVALVRQKPIQ